MINCNDSLRFLVNLTLDSESQATRDKWLEFKLHLRRCDSCRHLLPEVIMADIEQTRGLEALSSEIEGLGRAYMSDLTLPVATASEVFSNRVYTGPEYQRLIETAESTDRQVVQGVVGYCETWISGSDVTEFSYQRKDAVVSKLLECPDLDTLLDRFRELEETLIEAIQRLPSWTDRYLEWQLVLSYIDDLYLQRHNEA